MWEMVHYDNVKNVTTEEYFSNDQYTVDMFKTKYCLGEENTPAEVFDRVAREAAQFENPEDQEYWRSNWFSLMWEGWFRPGGSILSGVGSNKKISTANCSTIPIEGDSLEDISKAEYTLMKCAATRQGVGIDLSNLRPRGSKLGNAAEYSSGTIPWGTKFSNVGEYVGQNGRRCAVLLSEKIDHPDIEEFILSKLKRGAIESANISVQITDNFMDALNNDESWTLRFDTKRESIEKEIDPKYLIDLIAETASDSAEPGVQFIDRMREGTISNAIYKSTGDSIYEVISSNACCFADDTLIDTDVGTLSILEVQNKFNNGEEIKILSYDLNQDKYEFQPLEDVHIRENGEPQDLIELEIEKENGDIKTIQCTPDHKIYTKNRGWIEASKLLETDELLEVERMARIKSISTVKQKRKAYNLQVQRNRNYFAEGVLVKNSEKPLSAYNICNLLSINMEMFSINPEEFKEQLKKIVPFLVRLSDNVVEYELQYNLSPVEEQKEILYRMREIGLGITNLHGWLLKDNLQYDSDEAIEKAEEFMKYYSYNTFLSSIELGKEKGNASAFHELVKTEDLMYSSYIRNMVNEFFSGDPNKIEAMRNMANMSIAPVGSISSTFPTPCISSGIEPIIGPYYWRRTRAINKGEWSYYFIVPDRIKEYLLTMIPEDQREDRKYIENISGSVLDDDGKEGLQFIEVYKKYISDEFFKFAHQIDYNKKVELLGKLYNWVDAAISCTFNLPSDVTHEDVKQIYLYAYEQGVRAVSVYKEGSREGILIFQDPVTHKKEQNNKDILCSERPETVEYHCAPKRPETLTCNIHHTTVKGEKWLVLIGTLNGQPYELFAGQDDELSLPKSVETGTIAKNGKGKYDLNVKIRKREVEHKDIANVLMSAEQRALTRMISTCLRHGVPTEFITKQLKKSKEDITDFASAVSRVLSKYETGMFSENEICPECGNLMAVVEGCKKCLVCGKTSRCE